MYPHCSLKPRPAEHSLALSWFVLFTPFGEFQVEADLIEMGKTSGLAVDAYCPAVTKWAKAPQHPYRHLVEDLPKSRIQQPLYPGYLFVGLEPDERGDFPLAAIRAVRSDMEVLRSSGKPVTFPYASPQLHLDALMLASSDLPVTIFGLRLQEHFKAFDFTRDRKRAAAAVRRAQLKFRSFADLGEFVLGGRLAA